MGAMFQGFETPAPSLSTCFTSSEYKFPSFFLSVHTQKLSW